jgi:hypothetical protein
LAFVGDVFEEEPGGFIHRGEEPVVLDEFEGCVEGGLAAVEDGADEAGFGFVGPKRDGGGIGRGHKVGRWEGGKVGRWEGIGDLRFERVRGLF